MKFNYILKGKNTAAVTNYEGATAYALTPELELYAAAATAALSDQFYEKSGEKLERIRTLMTRVNPEFTARLAVYAREKMYLRSIPLVLAVELAAGQSGNALVQKLVRRVVQRADEITELLAYYALANGRTELKQLNKLSKQVQKGLAHAFNRFDEYQFAKYNRKAAISLRDALFLVHPKAANEAQQALFDKIATNRLQTPYTWETELSALGQQSFAGEKERQDAFRDIWEALIDSGKLGYMALLRNLRNILEAGVSSEHVEKVCALLGSERAVENAKQLPFRFLAAYRELKEVKSGAAGVILQALEKAVKASVCNLKGFDNKVRVVIACDVSGSMQKAVSARSKVMLYDIGLLLGMLLQSKCANVLSGMFGDRWKTISLPQDQVLANVDAFYKREGEVGYATNGYKVLDDLLARRHVADKIMMFTDLQLWDNRAGAAADTLKKSWAAYKRLAPKAKLYLFDLAGYGNTPLRVNDNDVYLLAGWSDKVFDVLQALENGESALSEINKIEL